MIAPVRRQRLGTQRTPSAQRPQKEGFSLRAFRPLRSLCVSFALSTVVSAHDLERTHVSIVFARDGSFVTDVANDPGWLKLRLESIPGPFADRIVLWVDGHEIHPSSVEFIPFDSPLTLSLSRGEQLAQGRAEGLSIYRMRGRVPVDAHTLRWFYGLVIDPYPLTIRRADRRLIVEEVAGNAWSRTIDLSGQFQAPLLSERTPGMLIAALLLLPIAIRFVTRRRINTKDTKDTKEIRCRA
jgi:hypothetical protein